MSAESGERLAGFAGRVDELANRVNNNGLSRVSPERFHVEKSDIALSLRRLARDLRGEVRLAPSTTWRPRGVDVRR